MSIIDLLKELLTRALEECLAQGTPEADIRDSLSSPTDADWRALRRSLGRQGYRGFRRWYLMSEFREQVDRCTGDLIDELIEDAKAA